MTKHITVAETIIDLAHKSSNFNKFIVLLVSEIIGEDDTEVRGTTQNPDNPNYWTKRTKYRNELRKEQREKLMKLLPDFSSSPDEPGKDDKR